MCKMYNEEEQKQGRIKQLRESIANIYKTIEEAANKKNYTEVEELELWLTAFQDELEELIK